MYARRVRERWADAESGEKVDLVTTGGWYGRVFSNSSHWNLIPMIAMDVYSFRIVRFQAKMQITTLWNKLQLSWERCRSLNGNLFALLW